MLSVDTNVLVRLFTRGETQQPAVASLFAGEQIWIAKTVFLEAEWILRSVYKFDAASVQNALERLLSLHNVQVEDRDCIASALELSRHGIELADAIHLSSSPAGVQFVTLDKDFIRRARRAGHAFINEVPQG